MKPLILTVILIAQTSFVFSQLNPPDIEELFRDNDVPRIDITIQNDLYIKLNKEIGVDTEYPATFKFSNSIIEEKLDSVGIRLKGNLSRVADKKSYKISTNSYIKGQKFEGIESINLIANSYDPMMIRPRLACYMARNFGITSLNTNYARLFVNGIFEGIYVTTEQVDEIFLKKWFGNSSGNLYKCRTVASLQYISDNQEDYKKLELAYNNGKERKYDLKTNTKKDDYSDLVEFIKTLNDKTASNFRDSISNYFNVQSFLKSLAFEIFIGQGDNYANWGNNYYLFKNGGNRPFEYIIFDTDLTFGLYLNQNVAFCNIYKPSFMLNDRPLVVNLLKVQEFRDMYSFYHKQLIAQFPKDTIQAIAELLQNQIEPYIMDDPYYTKSYSTDSFKYNMYNPVGKDIYGFMNFIGRRIDSTRAQLDNTNTAPIFSGFKSDVVYSYDTISISCLVENEEEELKVFLLYKMGNVDFDTITMNISDHKIIPFAKNCSVKLPPLNKAGELKIRIVATDEMGKTSYYPLNGEFVINIQKPNPELNINEIVAKNQNSITDEFGEHDDWLELVNNDTVTVLTHNCYLSDDQTNLGKWRLPEKVLKANGLMFVWVDEDEDQGESHANFKLSGDGETIYLSEKRNGVFIPLDVMKFGVQQADISFGPEIEGSGTSTFLQRITPGYTNNTKGLAFAIFNVNMNGQVANDNFNYDSDEVDVVGNFNNWDGTYSFSDPNRDTIFTYTVLEGLHENDNIEYRFRMHNNDNDIEFKATPGPEMHRKAKMKKGCNTFNIVFNNGYNSSSLPKKHESYDLYPNPVKDKLFIKTQNLPVEVIIFDPLGKKMYETQIKNEKSGVINFSNFPLGIYFIKILKGKEVYISKIIKTLN